MRVKKNIIYILILLIGFASFFWFSFSDLKFKNAEELISETPELKLLSNSETIKIKGKKTEDNQYNQNRENNKDNKDNPTEDKPENKGKNDKNEKDKNSKIQTKKDNKTSKSSKSKDDEGKNTNNKKENNNSPSNENEEFTDDPADVLVEETLSVDSLIQEIGLKGDDQIIYVKCVTGVGKDITIEALNGLYSLVLSTTGTTLIQVKYVDNNGNINTYIKKINYERPEGATPKGKEPVIHTNLKNMGVYNNPILNFDVWLTDYRGKSLSYNNAEILVNNEPADYVGEMSRQTYRTTLKAGSNTIEIKIKDKYQYTVKKKYTLYYKEGKGKILMSLEGGTVGKKYFIKPTEIEVEPGTPLSYVVVDFLEKHGYTYHYAGTLDEGFYLSRVLKKDMIKGYRIPKDLKEYIIKDTLIFDENNYESMDSLGEFDFCQGSGWMYSINGLYSSYGFNKAFVQDKDVVRIRFTLAYGKDISGYAVMDGTYGKLKQYDGDW